MENIVKMILGRELIAALEREIARYKEKADGNNAWAWEEGEAQYYYRWLPESVRSRQIEISTAGKLPAILLPDEQQCFNPADVIEYLHDHLLGDPDRWRIETGRGETTDLILWLDFSIRQDFDSGSDARIKKPRETILMDFGWEQAENRRKVDYEYETNFLA